MISTEVERFLLDSIGTVPHLEALLLIYQSPASVWTAAQLAARIYVSEKQATSILEDLARRALIARVEHSGYQFISRSPAQVQLFDQVVQAYRTELLAVTRLIHSNASSSVRDFARAFRLKD